MSNYIDSEDYEIEKKLAKKREEKNKYKKITNRKRLISLLTACNIFFTMSCIEKIKFVYENPFDGCMISSSDFEFNYKAAKTRSILEDENIKQSIEYMKKANIEEKKAYALYYSIIYNFNFTKEEKKELSAYINYAIDNKYLDYEQIYDTFNNLSIKRNVNLNSNIIGQYRENNEILLSKYATYDTLFHELCHSDKKNILPSWFEEGITELIMNEYYEEKIGTYSINKGTIRLLCEIIGKQKATDILFKIEATGNFDLLTEELVKRNIDKELCNELFETLENYQKNLIDNNLSSNDQILYTKKIRYILAIMYDKAYDNPKYINSYVSRLFLDFNLDLKKNKIFYLNSQKQKEYIYPLIISYYYPTDLLEEKEELRNIKEINNISYSKLYTNTLDKYDMNKIVTVKEYCHDIYTDVYIVDNNDNIISKSMTITPRNALDYAINEYEAYLKSNLKK